MSNHDARVPVPAGAPAGAVHDAPAPTHAAPTPAAPAPVAGLTVGHADDPAEHAADRMADLALDRLHRSAPGAGPHAHTPGCGHLRRSTTPTAGATIGTEGGTLDASTASRIEASRGGGAPMPDGVRRRMETAFGTGLAHVRVHDGPQAGKLSAAISAEAFTTGRDIFFGAGRFAPETPGGEKVLAHEIAHVLSEPGGVRRWNPFKKKRTPAEQADHDAKKQAEEEKASSAKKSKSVTEPAELAGLAESRKDGDAGRSTMTNALYGTPDAAPVVSGKVNAVGHVPLAKSGSGGRMDALYQDFNEALSREIAVVARLTKNQPRDSDETIADLAYSQVWEIEFPHLGAVAPPRKTAAERLVIQVRRARTDASVGASAAEAEAAPLTVKMLPKAIEEAYDRMVTHRDDLLAKDPDASPALAQEEAWDAVRKGMAAKELAGFPAKDGAVDVAAWSQAEARVQARTAQKARDADSIASSLALLPATQRIGPQPEVSGTAKKSESAQGVESKVEKGTKAVTTVGGGIAGFFGSRKDKTLREEQGITKDKASATGVPGAIDQGVGTAIVQGERAHKQLGSGQRKWKDQELPESDATKAKEGIGQVTGILNGIMSAVSSAFQMADSIEKSWSTKDPYEGLKAAKAGATGLDGLVSVAKSSADMAKLIDSSVTDGVKAVVPGLDIASSALAMVRGITDVATAGMRQRETDLTMFEARAGSTDKVNVMVYPLMKVSQVYTKHLEQTCWSLGVSVLNFSASVAQVASAGGFGIPAAIKAATAVVDNLHKIAHYIASKILNAMAKTAEKESAVMHVEGGAEDELRRHPKMAVDGIIIKAAAGDPTALMFLSNYRIDGKPITQDYVKQIKVKPVKAVDPKAKADTGAEQTTDDGLLLKVRGVVLAGMDTTADPQSVFEDLKAKGSAVTGVLSGISAAWAQTGELAEQRNQQAKDGKLGANTKSDRGLGWRIGQMFSSEKRGMLSEKTSALGAGQALPAGVACAVGTQELKDTASPPQIKAFTDSLTVEAIEAELKASPRRNSPEWIDFLREALRTKRKAPVGAGAP